jgi:hypothetical protein
MGKITIEAARHIEAQNRLALAVQALSAVRDLCCEASNAGPGSTLHHVDADHFACLLGILLDEMREAEAGLSLHE